MRRAWGNGHRTWRWPVCCTSLPPWSGPRTSEQLSGAQRTLEISLDDATLLWLDEIWPRPGTAQQAYAW